MDQFQVLVMYFVKYESGSTSHLNCYMDGGVADFCQFKKGHPQQCMYFKHWLWSDLCFLSGVFRGGHDVLVRARLALADGVTMQVTVRSSEETVVDVILASVG